MKGACGRYFAGGHRRQDCRAPRNSPLGRWRQRGGAGTRLINLLGRAVLHTPTALLLDGRSCPHVHMRRASTSCFTSSPGSQKRLPLQLRLTRRLGSKSTKRGSFCILRGHRSHDWPRHLLSWLTGLSLNPTPLLGCGRLRGRRPLQLPSCPGLLRARRRALLGRLKGGTDEIKLGSAAAGLYWMGNILEGERAKFSKHEVEPNVHVVAHGTRGRRAVAKRPPSAPSPAGRPPSCWPQSEWLRQSPDYGPSALPGSLLRGCQGPTF